MKKPLLVLGDFAWDVLIRTNNELLSGGDTFGEVMLTPGGSGANVAVWARRCGLETQFVGKIGCDRLGQLAQENLAEENVDAQFIQTSEHLTASVAVFVDHTGERSMVSGQGADFYLLPSELPTRSLETASHVHLTAWSFFTNPPREAARVAAKRAKQAGATLSFDPGSFQMIRDMGVQQFIDYTQDLEFDIILPNHEEGEALTGEAEPTRIAERLASMYPNALIMLKLDAQGALIFSNGVSTHVPPSDARLIDATGAGDSFAGSFLAHYLQHHDALDAARFATNISGWVIERLGARPAADKQLTAILNNPS